MRSARTASHPLKRRHGRNVSWALLLFALCIGMIGCYSTPHDIVSSVPRDSDLADLDRYLERWQGSYGEVIEWTPALEHPGSQRERGHNEFGAFLHKTIGPYDEWEATAEERNRFTGEIRFYNDDSHSSLVNSLIYIEGKLRKTDWGHLPG